MRVALKIAYEGRSFYGHQRQPDARTVEGECIAALRRARIFSDPHAAFFRSASRTDRGVSAVGNVIAFNSPFSPEAVIGAFNGKARDVWAWAAAAVPDSFHPRHAKERWYRYHLLEPPSVAQLRDAARLFEGEHDFRWFTSDPPIAPIALQSLEVTAHEGLVTIDVRARSFRRAMVRRIVAAMVACATNEIGAEDIRAALAGERHDFGLAPAEPLVLMDVAYDISFTLLVKPKVIDEWTRLQTELALRSRWLRFAFQAAGVAALSDGVGIPKPVPP